jgi:hypothetical protein
MFFTDGETGWSESHYDLQASTLIGAITTATTVLVPARIQLLAAGPWLKYIRASFDDTFRDSQVFFAPPNGFNAAGQNANNITWKNTPANAAWTVALLRGQSGDLYRKNVYISGIPYSDVTDVSAPFQDATLTAAFQAYSAVLLNTYGFPVWQRDIATFPLRPITAIQPGLNVFTITVPLHGVPNPPPAGSRAFLSKVKYFNPNKLKLNGPYGIISVVDANTLILTGPPPPVGFAFVSGFFQWQSKTVVPYTQFFLERFTHRKRGRPFDSPRGRSRRGAISRAF